MPGVRLIACLLCVLCVHASGRVVVARQNAGRQGAMRVTVDEVPLNGLFSMTQTRGDRLFLPLFSIARALGDAVSLDAAGRTVRVQRQTGVRAEFDYAQNLVRENGATVLVLSGAGEVDFPPQAEALMLPAEITSALLDVEIHIDTTARVVSVRRGKTLAAPVSTAARRGPLEIFDAEYDYNLDQYPTGYNHNLTLRTGGRLFDGLFSFTGNLGGATRQGFASFNTGTFAFERPNGQRLTAGDVGVANELTFMSSLVRGVWAQFPVRSTRVSAFAGRSAGGIFAPTPLEELQARDDVNVPVARPRVQTFDTKVLGAYVTFGPSKALQFSSGAMSFESSSRRGRLVTGGLRASSERFGLQADFGAGTFSGLQQDGSAVKGGGAAADISGSFKVRDDLTVQGRYTFNSRNFMTAQAGGPASLNLKSFGLTWNPRRWVTASFTDTASARPSRRDSGERFTTATLSLTPSRYLSSVFVSHTQYRTAQVRSGSYTLLNATKNFERWRLFANASRIKGLGRTYSYAQLGANLRVRENDSLQVSQTFGNNGTLGGTFDWMTQSLGTKRVSLGAGLGYSRSVGSPVNIYERLNANVNLPLGQTLQISYGRLQSGSQLHVSVRGPLFHKRSARAEVAAGAGELNRYGSVTGRVYQDLNFNGRYDAEVDQPQAGVRVRVDGNLSVDTDRNGLYHIDNVEAGGHNVALDLLSVRADLTILGDEAQAITLGSGFNTEVDFRTARTGRVAGTVWLDLNGNGTQDADEQGLADVRIVNSTGRDTLTNEDGQFVIGDLAPGLHILVVDIKTLPDETIVRALLKEPGQQSASGSLQVSVTAGAETGDIRFAVSPRPPERKQF